MTVDPIATRYAQAVFASAQAQGVVDETLEQLRLIGTLMREHAPLRELLENPDVDPREMVGLFERVLQGTWSALVRSCVELVVSFGRAEYLPQIADVFQELSDAQHDTVRVMVRCAHPQPPAALERLRKRLEHREDKHVLLSAEVDPGLLGGFQLMMGHRLIDGSVRRQLDDLRQRLMSVRVG